MNAVFTIVAKNYLPLAMTLGDSIKRIHPELAFHIFLADEIDEKFEPKDIGFPVMEVKDIGIENIHDLAFKYNVTEFCTSVKPFCFSFLFKKFGYEKLIYFDPDIYVLNSLDNIFEDLDLNFIVLTPHYVTPEINYTGSVPEGLILFVGIYNLGFLALKDNAQGRLLLSWWENRLRDKSYADKIEGFHTDQKWMDFVPALFDRGIKISKNLGYNISIWNLHERKIELLDGNYFVHHNNGNMPTVPLTFFHFAGFNPYDLTVIHKNYPNIKVSKHPWAESLLNLYKEDLINHQYERFIKLPYKYNFFGNNASIIQFQRRLYKQLVIGGWDFGNPFQLGDKSFYSLMKKNRMIVKNSRRSFDKMGKRELSEFSFKIKIINQGFRTLKWFLGFENYALLTKFFLRYFRPENQTFLLKEVKSHHFVNENME